MAQLAISNRNPTEMTPMRGRVLSDVTVIIPTLGRPILEDCLRAIARGTVLPRLAVVVDQGENPAVADWLRGAKAAGLETVHIRSPDRSAASARNCAIALVTTDFVAAVDDDCVVACDWLESMHRCLLQNRRALVTGRLLPAGGGTPPTVVTSCIPRTHTRPSVRILSPLASANMGFALETARKIGPFDERLAEAEENDWAYRALRSGIRIVFVPEIVVHHVHWRNEAEMVAVYRAYAWSQGVFYGKHLRNGDWSMIVRAARGVIGSCRVLISGYVRNDHTKMVNAYARATRLLPGVIAGFSGLGARQSR